MNKGEQDSRLADWARPTVQALLTDPAVHDPLKRVLRDWADRDPVDAALDADLLAAALGHAADMRCGQRTLVAEPRATSGPSAAEGRHGRLD